MGQFWVHRNRNPDSKAVYPLLLDVQSELLAELETRVVVPLSQAQEFVRRPLQNLMPIVTVEGEQYVAVTSQLAGIHKSELGRRISAIPEQREAIVAAIDFLITGI